MSAPNVELIRRIPKAELHCHLDGSVRASTLIELGREQGVPMPAADPEALAHHMWVQDARHLEDYLNRFDVTLSVLQAASALERVTYELLEDAAADGVRYIEMRFCPTLNTKGGLALDAAVAAPLSGIARAQETLGVTGRLIICALRHHPAAESLALAQLAQEFERQGVVGFDLAGGEAGHPASMHRAAFQWARDHGTHCTCHAGEGAGPESVADALRSCRPERIGHGTHLIEDPHLTDEVAKKGITVEACLTSNVQTRATPDYASHPMRAYDERGIRVTLNTDNRLMSRTTLTDEFVHASRALGYGFDDLCRIARNGFEAAFISETEKRDMLVAFDKDVRALAGSAA